MWLIAVLSITGLRYFKPVLAVCNPNPILQSGVLDPMGAIRRHQIFLLLAVKHIGARGAARARRQVLEFQTKTLAVAEVHDRMPVVLEPDQFEPWRRFDWHGNSNL
jgi:hypothetical protein